MEMYDDMLTQGVSESAVYRKLLPYFSVILSMLSGGCAGLQPPPLGGGSECKHCYVRMTIHEEKTDEGVTFSLLETENLHSMDFASHVPFRYSPGDDFYKDYILIVYDRRNRVLGRYPLFSARFVLWDDFSDPDNPKGGEDEFPESVITIVIPNDPRIWRIAMQDRGIEEGTGNRRRGSAVDLGIVSSKVRCGKSIKRNN